MAVVEMIVEVMVTITSRRDEGDDGICTFDTDVVGMLKAEQPDPKIHERRSDGDNKRAICANSGMSRRRCTELLFVMMFADVLPMWPQQLGVFFCGVTSPPPLNFLPLPPTLPMVLSKPDISCCCGVQTAASIKLAYTSS